MEKDLLLEWESVKDLPFESLNGLTLIDGLKRKRQFPKEFEQIFTGFPTLDKVINGGLQKRRIYLIAATPHNGKTTCLINLAKNIIEQGKAVLVFSFETPREQYIEKVVSVWKGISYNKFLESEKPHKMINESDLKKVESLLNDKIPLTICDEYDLDFVKIDGIIRKNHKERIEKGLPPIEFIVFDYAQNISCRKDGFQSQKHLELREFCRSLKKLGKELKICIILAAQLNAGGIKMDRRNCFSRPDATMIKECTYIHECVDFFMILHRVKRGSNEFKFYIEKNRQGPQTELDFYLEGESVGFVEPT